MLEVTNLQVLTWTPGVLDITWEIRPTFENPADFSFTVLRSESAGGPFDRISGPIVPPSAFRFRDNQVGPFSKIRQYRYRIRVSDGAETVEFGSRSREERARTGEIGSVGLEAQPDRIALAMNRRYELLLRAKVGRPMMLLQRMTFGQYCTCFDRDLQKKLREDCQLCWGVGFTGGYYSPVVVWAKLNPYGQGIRRTAELGEVHPSVSTLELSRFPPLKTGDLLVERENRRWHVGAVSTTQKRRATSRQIASVSELDAGRVEFRIPVEFPSGYEFLPESALRPRTDVAAVSSNQVILGSGG